MTCEYAEYINSVLEWSTYCAEKDTQCEFIYSIAVTYFQSIKKNKNITIKENGKERMIDFELQDTPELNYRITRAVYYLYSDMIYNIIEFNDDQLYNLAFDMYTFGLREVFLHRVNFIFRIAPEIIESINKVFKTITFDKTVKLNNNILCTVFYHFIRLSRIYSRFYKSTNPHITSMRDDGVIDRMKKEKVDLLFR